MLEGDISSFLYFDSVEKVVLLSFSDQNSCDRPIKPAGLLLDPVDIFEFLQVFIAVVIFFHILLDLLSKALLNFWVLGDEVNHHLNIIGSGVRSCYEERAELLQNFTLTIGLQVIIFTLFLSERLIHYKGFNDVCWGSLLS